MSSIVTANEFVIYIINTNQKFLNHSSSIVTSSLNSTETPSPSSLSFSTNKSNQSNQSLVQPSLEASEIASLVNVPVVINKPLSVLPTIAPRKSLISFAPTFPLYLLH